MTPPTAVVASPQPAGYQPGIDTTPEIQRTAWLRQQPGFNPKLVGPPTPFAQQIFQQTPLAQYEQDYFNALERLTEGYRNRNLTANELNQLERAERLAESKYTTHYKLLNAQERAIQKIIDDNNKIK